MKQFAEFLNENEFQVKFNSTTEKPDCSGLKAKVYFWHIWDNKFVPILTHSFSNHENETIICTTGSLGLPIEKNFLYDLEELVSFYASGEPELFFRFKLVIEGVTEWNTVHRWYLNDAFIS